MLERDFQTQFNRWLKYRWNTTGAFELKLVKGTSIPFTAIREHQLQNLHNTKHSHLIYKIPDAGFSQKPYDCVAFYGAAAYIVVMFYERGNKEFFMIDIDDWNTAVSNSQKKSFTEDEVRQFGKSYFLGV